MDDTVTYGAWVRRRRRELDLTQAELARRVGCALTTIEKLEADARRPSKAMAERLADALDLAPGTRPGFLSGARSGWMGEETGSRTPPAPVDRLDAWRCSAGAAHAADRSCTRGRRGVRCA